MLTELETLSQNIGKLIAISQRHHETSLALRAQLAEAHAEIEAAHAELAQTREARDALQAERDALSAKIDDAQVRLNAILEKLPRARSQSEPDSQLDLLASAQQEDESGSASHRHGESA